MLLHHVAADTRRHAVSNTTRKESARKVFAVLIEHAMTMWVHGEEAFDLLDDSRLQLPERVQQLLAPGLRLVDHLIEQVFDVPVVCGTHRDAPA